MATDEKTYYYADGERQELELDPDSVAIDLEPLAEDSALRERARELTADGRSLRRQVYLVERGRVSAEDERDLAAKGAIQPVFRHGETLLVALPEVRVEAAGRDKQSSLRKLLEEPEVEAELVRDRGEQLTLRPKSGSGLEALKLANRLHEELEPELAQVRFLRLVPRPDTKR